MRKKVSTKPWSTATNTGIFSSGGYKFIDHRPISERILVIIKTFIDIADHQKTKKTKAYSSPNQATMSSMTTTPHSPVENQPFLNAGPQTALKSNGNVSYQPNGSSRPGSTLGYADLGAAGNGSLNGSQQGGSLSRIVTPVQTTYPYTGTAAASLAGGGPGSVIGGRGTPAITIGPPGTGRMTPAPDHVSMRSNPSTYPYGPAGGPAVPSRQLSNVSDTSRGSSYYGGQPQPLGYPPVRQGSSLDSSLV